MRVDEVGEFALIQRITEGLSLPDHVLLGPGDDAAVLRLSGAAVWSTDTLVEDVHFRCHWSAAKDIGRKSIAVSVADLEAMGAQPVGVLVSLSVPPETTADWVTEFAAGVRAECELSGAALLGGDLTRSRDITISVSVLGDLAGREPVTRSGAQPGDEVAVLGNLGLAAAGLAVLSRGFRSPKDAVLAHRCPTPAYGAGAQVAGLAHAMIDVSDGLLADLAHVARASRVTIAVETARLPVAEPQQAVAAALGRVDPLSFVLTGGEDHALAACFAPGQTPDDWRVIGRVLAAVPEKPVLVDGEVWAGESGWTHF